MATELATRFEEFIEEQTFQEMSKQTYALGIPLAARHALAIIRRKARELFNKRSFKAIFDLTSKTLSTATKLPMPENTIVELIGGEQYFPPVIDLIDHMHLPFRRLCKSGTFVEECVIQIASVEVHVKITE